MASRNTPERKLLIRWSEQTLNLSVAAMVSKIAWASRVRTSWVQRFAQ